MFSRIAPSVPLTLLLLAACVPEKVEPPVTTDSAADDSQPDSTPITDSDPGTDSDTEPTDDLTDDDGDGLNELGGDCDDTNPNISPFEPERCDNAVDDNCNGETDEDCGTTLVDLDGDGYSEDADCNDGDPRIHPTAEELCGNSVDEDCDGVLDDGCPDPVCEDPPPAEPIEGPECITRDVVCGETFEATTAGGTDSFTGDAYENWYCVVSPDPYEGTERVYRLDLESDADVTVTVESPCEEVDLMVLRWQYDDCPTAESSSASRCEGSADAGDDSILADGAVGDRWLIIVDTPAGVDTPYTVTITCDTN